MFDISLDFKRLFPENTNDDILYIDMQRFIAGSEEWVFVYMRVYVCAHVHICEFAHAWVFKPWMQQKDF